MNLLVIEFITAGGCHGASLPRELAEEGEYMLQAVLRDAAGLTDVRVIVPRDVRMAPPGDDVDAITVSGEPWGAWRQLMSAADAALLIAPETDGALHRLVGLAESTGTPVVGSASTAVAIASSKRETAARLALHGVPVAATVRLTDVLPSSEHGWVVKPDDGVGSEDVWFVADDVAARRTGSRLANAIVQPFLPGDPLSLSMLCAGNACRLLACNRQRRVNDGDRLRQIGVEVNGARQHLAALSALAGAIAAAIPGLGGYVGADLIMTPEGPVVLEVNPRLTTAYAGLSSSLGRNALALLLGAWRGDRMPLTVDLAATPVWVMPHA